MARRDYAVVRALLPPRVADRYRQLVRSEARTAAADLRAYIVRRVDQALPSAAENQ